MSNAGNIRLAVNGQQLAASCTLPEMLAYFSTLGVNALEIWPANLSGGAGSEEQERYEAKDVASASRLIQESGFCVAAVTLGYWAAPISFSRGGRSAFTSALRGAIDAALIFGASIVNCYSAGISMRLFAEAIQPAAEYAERHGVVITLENEAHDESGVPHAVAAIVEDVASAGFATLFDPCNYYHAWQEPFPYAYEVISKHIRYVHLKGGCLYPELPSGGYPLHQGSLMRDSRHQHIGYVPLPHAAFPVEAVVRQLIRNGYHGFITLEPHVPTELLPAFYAAEVPYLQALLGDAKVE